MEIDKQDFPERLRESRYPPERLYCEGDSGLLKSERLIAVVGTRRMSEYGRAVTAHFVRGLVEAGYVIVSGLARGVDRVAHETCLDCGGKTVAVLAHGLQMTYPPEHQKLRQRIVREGGLVMTEWPTGVGLTKQQLILRNRIVVGVSQAVLVTESPQSSGTQNTVGWAAEMGRDVYVIPGPSNDPTYAGTMGLVRDGCIPVGSTEALIEQLGV